MNKAGKTMTIFLVVITILLLSLTVISIFFYNTEKELRKSLEVKLAQAKAQETKLEAELKETKTQIFVLGGKVKEDDEKISGLMDELELQEAVKKQMKEDNSALKDSLSKKTQDKEALNTELVAVQEKIATIEAKLKSAEDLRAETEGKLKEIEQGVSQQSGVQLEKIVVKPGETPQGKIVSINNDNNFVIFNLGEEHGVKQDMLMSVYRGEKYLGDLKVARAQEGMSVADFIPPLTNKQVKKDDKVVPKK